MISMSYRRSAAQSFLVTRKLWKVSSSVAWDRVSGPDHPVPRQPHPVHRVIKEGVAIMDNECREDRIARVIDAFGSLRASCVAGRACGIIYLDSTIRDAAFSEDDLQLLAAIAGLAAIAIENACLVERLGTENQRLRAEISLQHDMVGQSPRMRQVYQFMRRWLRAIPRS